MDKNLRLYMAELIGTFALVFVGAGAWCACQLAVEPGQITPGLVVAVATAEGLVLAAALAVTVPLSGGYLNPAITLMLYVFKRFELGKTTGLIFVQLLGAAIAGALLRVCLTTRQDILTAAHLGTPHVNPDSFGVPGVGLRLVPAGVILSGVGIELVLTFILTFVIFGTLIDPRAPRLLGPLGRWLSPLWVGLAMAALTLAGFYWTGAATNPARYFGTGIWELTVNPLTSPLADHMAYWIGPIVGALLAGGAYMYLILPQEQAAATPAAGPAASGKKAAGAGSTLFRAKK
ncbi:MAG TPA: aquaporin [Gemmataceae bacterium]|nr:aquaporin [Gemmataceae bacterium]